MTSIIEPELMHLRVNYLYIINNACLFALDHRVLEKGMFQMLLIDLCVPLAEFPTKWWNNLFSMPPYHSNDAPV